MYAAAAAAMYMAQQNPYYANMNSAAVYGPQYGLGGYPVNPAMLAPMMAGYPPPVFDPPAGNPPEPGKVRCAECGGDFAEDDTLHQFFRVEGRTLHQLQ